MATQKQTIRGYVRKLKRHGRGKKKRNKHDSSKPYCRGGRG